MKPFGSQRVGISSLSFTYHISPISTSLIILGGSTGFPSTVLCMKGRTIIVTVDDFERRGKGCGFGRLRTAKQSRKGTHQSKE